LACGSELWTSASKRGSSARLGYLSECCVYVFRRCPIIPSEFVTIVRSVAFAVTITPVPSTSIDQYSRVS
jgi:hypothetical protein